MQSQSPATRKPNFKSLLTNAFSIKLQNKLVYSYKFSIIREDDNSDLQYVCKLIGNKIYKHIHNMIGKSLYSDTNPRSIAIDMHAETIYSLSQLQIEKQGFNLLDEDTNNIDKYVRYFVVDCEDVDKFKIKVTIWQGEQLNLTMQSKNSAPVVFSIIQHQMYEKLTKYNNSYYCLKDPRCIARDINSLTKIISGLSLSGMRFVNLDRMFLNINKPYGAFVKTKKMIDLLNEYSSTSELPNKRTKFDQDDPLTFNDCKDTSWYKKFASDVTNLKCRVRLPNYRSTFRLKLTSEPAYKLFFHWTERDRSINVVDFYKEKYNLKLKYPNLTCLQRTTATRGAAYYPIEYCSLIDDRFNMANVDSEVEKVLSQISSATPDERFSRCCQARNNVANIASEYMSQYGVELSRDPIVVEARHLKKPVLLYGNGKRESLQKSFWESGPFYKSGCLDDWRVVSTTALDVLSIRNFISKLSERLSSLGLNSTQPKVMIQYKEKMTVNKLEEHTSGNIKLVVFIIDNESTMLRRLIHKVFDSSKNKTGAICIRVENIKNKLDFAVRTLVHKINTRLNGTNVAFETLGVPESSVKLSSLMVIGLDVTHPDHEMKTASIAGCTYTYGCDLFRHKSLYCLQKAKQEAIGQSESLFSEVMRDYLNENDDKLPERIIVYRDGVSEEFFPLIRDNEISVLESVLKKISIQKNQAVPSISFVIVQKRHSTRLFAQNGRVLVNPKSGTIIDTGIVPDNGNEFFLFSHTCFKFTARPTHYHILRNDKLTNQELQQITYSLCFNFGKNTSIIAIPTSLKYADAVAFEAREQLLAAKNEETQQPSVEGTYKSSRFFC